MGTLAESKKRATREPKDDNVCVPSVTTGSTEAALDAPRTAARHRDQPTHEIS